MRQSELERALVLYGAMLRLRNHGVAVPVLQLLKDFLNALRRSRIPWPLLDHLEDAIIMVREELISFEDFMKEGEFMREDGLAAFTRDYIIWIVERYYRPSSLSQVRSLRPEFQKAGLAYLLYTCFEQERPYLTEHEYGVLQRLFENWINAVWDADSEALMAALEENGISTTGQFIAWVRKCSTRLTVDKSVAPVIEELEQQAA